MPVVFVVMGVSGCGKSTAGTLLAVQLGCPFYEGDSFHPAANIEKMRAGIPLTDEDRWPWLLQLAAIVRRHVSSRQLAVLSCSALKPAYRQLLRGHVASSDRATEGAGHSEELPSQPGTTGSGEDVAFILLDPPRAWLERRLQGRAASSTHFMPMSLLDSQLATLQCEEKELWLHVMSETGCGSDAAVAEDDSCVGSSASDGFPLPEQVVQQIMHRLRSGDALGDM